MKRRYFISDRVSPYELEALESCIGENWTQRYSLDHSQLIIKVDAGFLEKQDDGFINKLGIEYSLSDLKILISSDLWE